MKERGIIFNGAMVRSILSGKKTQTRRIMKPQPEPVPGNPGEYWWPSNVFETMLKMSDFHHVGFEGVAADASPFGSIGDRLWVRETFGDCGVRLVYRADTDDGAACQVTRWIPSIHMPRSDCRILLEITSVRVERITDISDEDCQREGCQGGHGSIPNYPYNATPREHFSHFWQSIYGEESWKANPWVWVVEFRVITGGAA